MEPHKAFTTWAVAQGIQLDGIAPDILPGKGLGIVAERKLGAGETVLVAPISVLRTVHTLPKRIAKPINSIHTISVNGLLAAELAMDTSKSRAPWRAILPTRDDLEKSLPFMWHASLQALLPSALLSLVANQRRKISYDWSAVSQAFPALSYDVYVYNWFVISTRTFYYTSAKMKTPKPPVHDDCLALIPLADCFNHADVGCEVTFSAAGYEFTTERPIEAGEEVHISYGKHSNDFLLAEYGFLLVENGWDEICLDEILLPLFAEEQKQTLKEEGFLGRFALSRDMVCYRTQVALRLLCMPAKRWQVLVASGSAAEDDNQTAVDAILLRALKSFLQVVGEKLEQAKVLDCGLQSQRDTLWRRWKQIQILVATSISQIES